MQAAGAHPVAPVEQVVEKEKTTHGPRRGSSNDPKSQTGERNKDDRDSNRRRPRDRLPQDNRYDGRGEDRKRDHGDDDYGGGDDDDPRHCKDKNERDVKRRVASPERITQMWEGVEMTQTHRRTTTQIGEKGIQRGTKRRTENPERNVQGTMTTEEETIHRLTVKRKMMSICPPDGGKDGGLHTAQNQVILKRPAQAITGGKQSTA
jgi:hypothetical protein